MVWHGGSRGMGKAGSRGVDLAFLRRSPVATPAGRAETQLACSPSHGGTPGAAMGTQPVAEPLQQANNFIGPGRREVDTLRGQFPNAGGHRSGNIPGPSNRGNSERSAWGRSGLWGPSLGHDQVPRAASIESEKTLSGLALGTVREAVGGTAQLVPKTDVVEPGGKKTDLKQQQADESRRRTRSGAGPRQMPGPTGTLPQSPLLKNTRPQAKERPQPPKRKEKDEKKRKKNEKKKKEKTKEKKKAKKKEKKKKEKSSSGPPGPSRGKLLRVLAVQGIPLCDLTLRGPAKKRASWSREKEERENLSA